MLLGTSATLYDLKMVGIIYKSSETILNKLVFSKTRLIYYYVTTK